MLAHMTLTLISQPICRRSPRPPPHPGVPRAQAATQPDGSAGPCGGAARPCCAGCIACAGPRQVGLGGDVWVVGCGGASRHGPLPVGVAVGAVMVVRFGVGRVAWAGRAWAGDVMWQRLCSADWWLRVQGTLLSTHARPPSYNEQLKQHHSMHFLPSTRVLAPSCFRFCAAWQTA